MLSILHMASQASHESIRPTDARCSMTTQSAWSLGDSRFRLEEGLFRPETGLSTCRNQPGPRSLPSELCTSHHLAVLPFSVHWIWCAATVPRSLILCYRLGTAAADSFLHL